MKGLIYINKKPHSAVCRFALGGDIEAILRWKKEMPDTKDPVVEDALEFAELAGKRWRSYQQLKRVISSLAQLKSRIRAHPSEEFVMMAVIKCDAPTCPPILGFCLFRRTWCNHLALDFLAVNQQGRAGLGPKVGGVGTFLVGFVCRLAADIGAAQICCETTQRSAQIYETWFMLKELRDVMQVPAQSAADFLSRLHAGWKQYGLK